MARIRINDQFHLVPLVIGLESYISQSGLGRLPTGGLIQIVRGPTGGLTFFSIIMKEI
jgi:hypothetical protein